jgi:hypothetical protein
MQPKHAHSRWVLVDQPIDQATIARSISLLAWGSPTEYLRCLILIRTLAS